MKTKNILPFTAFSMVLLIIACSNKPGSSGSGGGSSSSSSSSSSVSSISYNYYVATNGNDTNTGTSAQPFRTITHAVSVAGVNKTIKVSPGTYSNGEIFPITLKAGQGLYGDPANLGVGTIPIVIAGTNTNILDGWNSPLLYLTNTAVVSGFSLGLSAYLIGGAAIVVSNANATIISNTFNLESYMGVDLDYTNNSLVAFNNFTVIDSYCIFVNDWFSGSLIIASNSIVSGSVGIRIDSSTNSTVIMNNAFASNNMESIQLCHGSPVISNNYFTNSGTFYGTLWVGADHPVIRGNHFKCTYNAISINGGINANPDMGTASSPGGNDFSLVASNAVWMESNTYTTNYAVGNTWLHNPPTSNDIYFSPTSTGRVVYDSAGDFLGQ